MSKLQLGAFAVPVVDPSPQAPPGMQDLAATGLGYLMWTAGIACFVAIVVLGITFMFNAMGRTNGAKDVVGPVGWIIVGTGMATAASAIAQELMGVSIPVTPIAPPGADTGVNLILGYLVWFGGAGCLLAIITLGIIFILNATGRTNGAKAVVIPVGWIGLGTFAVAGASAITYQLIGV